MKNIYFTLSLFTFCTTIFSQNLQSNFSVDKSNYCDSTSITVVDSSIGANSWEYYLNLYGDTILYSNQQNPSFHLGEIEYGFPIYLEQIVHSGNQADSSTTILTLPDLELNSWIEYDQDTLTFDFDVEGDFSNSSTLWDFGDGATSPEKNPTHTYSSPGIYTVTVSLTNADVCGGNSIQLFLNTQLEPLADFQSNQSNICLGESINFFENTRYADSISWYFEEGTPSFSTDNNVSVSYEKNGSFDVLLIANNYSFTDTLLLEDYVQVNGNPISEFYYQINDKEVQFNNASKQATNSFWAFGEGNTSNEQNPTHMYANAGTYNVQLIATNKCGRDTVTYTVYIPKTTSADRVQTNSIKVFPNPFENKLQIKWEHTLPKGGKLKIVDLTGKVIWKSELSNESVQEYDLSSVELYEGMYILHIKSEKHYYSERLVHIN